MYLKNTENILDNGAVASNFQATLSPLEASIQETKHLFEVFPGICPALWLCLSLCFNGHLWLGPLVTFGGAEFFTWHPRQQHTVGTCKMAVEVKKKKSGFLKTTIFQEKKRILYKPFGIMSPSGRQE